jgi:PncC family amidohydrolase
MVSQKNYSCSTGTISKENGSGLPVVGIVDDLSEINEHTLRALAAQTLSCARESSLKLGTAESCTGGLIAGMLTAIPGSSDTINGGIVSYSNGIKHAILGVRSQTLDRYGAVSEETACEMARGARVKLSVDVAVSVTGIAGPGGAEPGKPIGTVWIGLSHSEMTYAKIFHFDGDRDMVRNQTVYNALLMVKNAVQSIKSSSEAL